MTTLTAARAVLYGVLIAISAWLATTDCGASASNPASHGADWRVLRIGGGGYLTGLDASPDGSALIVRADTYGAYLWSQARRQWTQLVTAGSMPASDVGVDKAAGVYEIRVAPGQPTRFYMGYRGYVYRSDVSGAKWTRTSFAKTEMDANDGFRTFGQKMAVDPINPDVVYVGTSREGLRVTRDGGGTWETVADVPASEASADGGYPGVAGIAFDPGSGALAGRTRTVYASSYGHGVYRTDDGGASWTALQGGPTNVSHGKIAKDGVYYVVGDDGSSVWRADGSGWTNITPDADGGAAAKGAWSTVVTDPFDAARVIAVRGDGSLIVSLDRGATWDGGDWRGEAIRRTAPDVPWLAWTQESWMSVGDMLLDPTTPNRLWFAEGIGVWRATIRRPGASPSFAFVSQTAGIEQLVANQILAPPGGKPVLASWDRPVFRVDNPDVYPAAHGPDGSHAIVTGWAIDYAAKNPAFVAGIFDFWGVEKSGFSSDGGRTWSPFAAYPAAVNDGKIGGSVAVSTPLNMIWAPSNNAEPYYTTDGGATWSPILLPGVPRDGQTGWSSAYFLNRHTVAADRVSEGTFYLYNALKGLYRSTDGGANWALVHEGEIAPFSGFNATLRSVPGQAGHLFFTSGPQGGSGDRHPARNAFVRSEDGGVTWRAVEGVLEVRAFGFGKARADYPTIYIVGWVRGDYGIWRSADAAASWVKIGEFPLGILDNVKTIEGDGDDARRVYVGFSGAGYVYGVEPP